MSALKFAELDRMIGGVITPANILSACWNPKSAARRSGMESLSPKKGAGLVAFFINGRFGLKRNA
jgi:hypothetical protein